MKKTMPVVMPLMLALCAAAGETNELAIVRKDRVNLRAAPNMQAEVVSQAASGDVVTIVRREGPWCAILPPTNVSFYVYAHYVQGGVVTAATLQVRSGPGINFRPTGILRRGQTVSTRGQHGSWLRIAPPPDTLLWVHSEFLETIEPAPPKENVPCEPAHATPSPDASPSNAPQGAPISIPVVPPLSPPLSKWLAEHAISPPLTVTRIGRVQPVDFLFRRPAHYRLVQTAPGAPATTLAYLRDNDDTVGKWVGLIVRVHGREYRLRGYHHPLLVADRIERVP